MANLEKHLVLIEARLQSGTWRSGGYTEIEIFEPKHRLVSAAPFRDRVVHHALCSVVAPIFERGFIEDSYANRVGYGTHRAVRRYEHYRDRYRYVLRCDIYRYFPAIDHAILKRDLRRRIACEPTLALMDTIIDGSNAQEPVNLIFPGDDLFMPPSRLSQPVPRPVTAHEFALNFSRSWGLWEMYSVSVHPEYIDAYVDHVQATLGNSANWDGDYGRVGHWVPQFGMFAIQPLFGSRFSPSESAP